ncbi:hypothetical protein BN136_3645 [Cronobacter universalis NCTC 9529]|nr:hypothetical protein BN136_3645 [Cronobacter universalis NCTC 9529]
MNYQLTFRKYFTFFINETARFKIFRLKSHHEGCMALN